MKLDKTLDYAPAHLLHYDYICGIDEVGRGCGAGPVVTAAVILPKDFKSPLLRDSKKLSEKQRNEAYKVIIDNAIGISCKAGSVKDIDLIGINPTTFKTMHECIGELNTNLSQRYFTSEISWSQQKQMNEWKDQNRVPHKIQAILLDGTEWDKNSSIKVELVTKGDDTYMCIAAAAIIAKVRRDEYMTKLHDLYPHYGWNSNKGYLTETHIKALKENGGCKYHRNQYIRNII